MQLSVSATLTQTQLVCPALNCLLKLALKNFFPLLHLQLDVLVGLLLHDPLKFNAHIVHVQTFTVRFFFLLLQLFTSHLLVDFHLDLFLLLVGVLDFQVCHANLVLVFFLLGGPNHLE